jgi:biotin carboxyl carrier protein
MSRYRVKVGDKLHDVTVDDVTGHPVTVTVDGRPFEVWIQEDEGPPPAASAPAPLAAAPASAAVIQTPDPLTVAAQPRRMERGGRTVRAPMPGKITQVAVAAGQTVERGQLLCVLEAMKMNNQVRSPREGTIGEIVTATGEQVNYGDPLVVFEL